MSVKICGFFFKIHWVWLSVPAHWLCHKIITTTMTISITKTNYVEIVALIALTSIRNTRISTTLCVSWWRSVRSVPQTVSVGVRFMSFAFSFVLNQKMHTLQDLAQAIGFTADWEHSFARHLIPWLFLLFLSCCTALELCYSVLILPSAKTCKASKQFFKHTFTFI